MKKFRQLSYNQKLTIVILIVIPLSAVLIPMVYENLNKPNIKLSYVGCSESSLTLQERTDVVMVYNKGRAPATNLEIKMIAKPSVVINIDDAPSAASVSVTPIGNPTSPEVNEVIIKVPTLPASSSFAMIIFYFPKSSDADQTYAQYLLPDNMPFKISQVWYDQGSFEFENAFSVCSQMIEATVTSAAIDVTTTP